MMANFHKFAVIAKTVIIICLCLFYHQYSTSAASPVLLLNTIPVEMYELNLDGSLPTDLRPCTSQNDNLNQYGCTAIPNDISFLYPYSSSTPSISVENDYLLDVIAQEMSPQVWSEPAALKAQAIVSRSFANWHINNGSQLNNSTQFQTFLPWRFEKLGTTNLNNTTSPCNSTNLEDTQQQICTATVDNYFIAQAQNNPNHYPAKALFHADVKLQTADATFDKPYLTSVEEPISEECDADDEGQLYGMSQRGANRWARGHECSFANADIVGNNAPGGDWSVRWETAEQILTHYYTGVHLRNGADNNARLTPEYRWNPLSVSWSGAGCPSVITAGGTCTATFHIQNTGTKTWFPGRVNFRHRGWEQETSGVRMLESTTTLTRSIPPGDDVEVEITVRAGGSVESGERYQLRFEMGLEEDPGGWVGFSEVEAGRSWPTYEVSFCIDACRTHLPLVVKNAVPGCQLYSNHWHPTGNNYCDPTSTPQCNEADGMPDEIPAGPFPIDKNDTNSYHQVEFSPQLVQENTEIAVYWKSETGVTGNGNLYFHAKIDNEWVSLGTAGNQSSTNWRWWSPNNPGIGAYKLTVRSKKWKNDDERLVG